MRYSEWNEAIARHFFRPEMRGRRVFLYINEDVINDIGREFGKGYSSFLNSVKNYDASQLCQITLDKKAQWQADTRAVTYPPYLTSLAVFVLAAKMDGDFAPHSYYPRLRELLGDEPEPGTPQKFGDMQRIWTDLQHWANSDRRGKLGFFYVTRVGQRTNVDIPLAQKLLSQNELAALPRFFSQAVLDPSTPPVASELPALMSKYGKDTFAASSLRLLERGDKQTAEARLALVNIVLDELQRWDLSIGADSIEKGARWASAPLRLALTLDRIAKSSQASLFCKYDGDFPEGGLLLKDQESKRVLKCGEPYGGWLGPLMTHPNSDSFDAAQLDWSKSLKLIDKECRWTLTARGASVRLFVSGESENIPGLIEVSQRPYNQSFYMAVSQNLQDKFEKWGSQCTQGFQRIELAHGLPDGWKLYAINSVHCDAEIRELCPGLTLTKRPQIVIVGGIRATGRHEYFPFAPPDISIRGDASNTNLTANGIQLEMASAGLYHLPKDAISSRAVNLQLYQGNEEVDDKDIYLMPNLHWPPPTGSARFDRFGRLLQYEVQNTIFGAIINGFDADELGAGFIVPSEGSQSVILIGKTPGQIAHWPVEEVPNDWTPIWAIQKFRRRRRVVYCGTDLKKERPSLITKYERSRVKEWKDALWHERKKTSPPEHPVLLCLWKEYQHEAEHVKAK